MNQSINQPVTDFTNFITGNMLMLHFFIDLYGSWRINATPMQLTVRFN